MGMTTGGSRRLLADINVTPLVDVILVLLVIFMITAPATKEGFQVELPQATGTDSIVVQDVWVVCITADGKVLRRNANESTDAYAELASLVQDLVEYRESSSTTSTPPSVVIQGDKRVNYERIIQVWNAIRSAGITRVSFQIDPG